MSMTPYASAIGSIMYTMLCSRPDVSYALSVTSRYQSDPGEGHWVAFKNILKYLRRTMDAFFYYWRWGSYGKMLANNPIEMTPNLNQTKCSH